MTASKKSVPCAYCQTPMLIDLKAKRGLCWKCVMKGFYFHHGEILQFQIPEEEPVKCKKRKV